MIAVIETNIYVITNNQPCCILENQDRCHHIFVLRRKNGNIEFRAHDAFLGEHSPGTLIIK